MSHRRHAAAVNSRSTSVGALAAAALAALALAIPGATIPALAAGAAPLPKPHVLLRVPLVEGFAQDGSRIVWADSTRPCARRVQLRDLTTGRTTPLAGRRGRACTDDFMAGFQHRMALAGTRALWGTVSASLSSYHVSVATAAPGSVERSLGTISMRSDDGRPFRPVPMAGDGASLVYAAIGDSEEQFAAGVLRVGARATLVTGTERTSAVAAHGPVFAAARVHVGGCRCHAGLAWSPDGRRVAYSGRHSTVDRSDVYVTEVDGGATRRIQSGSSGPHWSPDGRHVAAPLHASPTTPIVDAEGRRVASVPGSFRGWSVDGRLVYVTADTTLAVRGVDGPATVLSAGTGSIGAVEWSPDGRHVLYLRDLPHPAGSAVMVVPSEGGTARRLGTAGDWREAYWSPDGREIAFFDAQGLTIADAASGAIRRLDAQGSRLVGWSHDGSRLAYLADDLFSVDRNGDGSRRLAGPVQSAAWSPRRDELLTTRWDGRSVLEVVRGGQSGATRLAIGTDPAWSPDGETIAFAAGEEGEITTIRRDGTDRRTVTRTSVPPTRHPLELRLVRTGARIGGFDLGPVDVRAGAIDARNVALIVARGRAARFLEVRSRRGVLLRRIVLPRDAADEIGLSGRWIVYRVGATIRLVDRRGWADRVLARAAGTVVGLSIEGSRVAWGEQLHGPDVIRAVTLPG